MNIFLKISITFVGIIMLSNCGMMHADCSTLRGDAAAYRECMANQGSQDFQYQLGLEAYENEDYDTAIKWLKRATVTRVDNLPYYAERERPRRGTVAAMNVRKPNPGHRGAMRMLANMYEQGIGVDVDLKRAQRYRDMINRP